MQSRRAGNFPLLMGMEIWGIGAYLLDEHVTQYVAEKVFSNVDTCLSGIGAISEVGCSRKGQNYELYIKFSVIPSTAERIVRALAEAFNGLSALSGDLINPFTMSRGKQCSVPFKNADEALAQLRENMQQIQRNVTEGADFYLHKVDMY